MLLHVLVSLSPFLFAPSTSAPAPAPVFVPPTPACTIDSNFINVTSSDPYYGVWSMAYAAPVISNSEPAILDASYSVTVGTTVTVGVTLGLTEELSSIYDAEASVGFQKSWSTFSTNGWTAGEECPPGTPLPYTCGMSAIPHFQTVSGMYFGTYQGCDGKNGEDNGAVVPPGPVPFSFEAPVLDTGVNAPDKKLHNMFTFSACICALSKNQTTGPGLGHCPEPSC